MIGNYKFRQCLPHNPGYDQPLQFQNFYFLLAKIVAKRSLNRGKAKYFNGGNT